MSAAVEKVEVDEEVKALLALAKPPPSLDALHLVTKLNFPDCGLSSLPANLGTFLPNLSILFCPKNNFEELPAAIGSCPSLQMVSFKSNKMKRLHPEALQPQLRWLILTDNDIEVVPPEIGRCVKLQKLMLAGNQIREIADEISNCTNLELVRLASNRLTAPPMALLSLPNLAWVALSDNPFLNGSTTTTVPDLPVLQGMDESSGELLGQGASGVTRKVLHGTTAVACKTYIGTMTSDGNPQEEKKLSVVASTIASPCLISVLGQTPSGSLVMELLEGYSALAGPPSMDSCSRDVYTDGMTMGATVAVSLVKGLLQVMCALHELGICHGDFYGHNILIADGAKVKLSDFGAAFFYDKAAGYGELIQQIEMRAFRIMVEEVEQLVDGTGGACLLEFAKKCRQATSFEELQQSGNDLLVH